ncbi:MAG: hypothetical protein NTW87_35850, partial [Planctomycetota bacterium]|nr:hypothetical protein [Planctomycetota bacterium]
MSRLRRLVANRHLQAALILAGVLVVFYRDVVFRGKTFLTENSAAGTMAGAGPYGYAQPPIAWYRVGAVDRSANGWIHEPSVYRLGHALRGGEMPLWDPHTGLGQPWLVAGQTGACEPIQAAFSLVPQSGWHYATDAQLLLRFWLAGFFTYLLLLELGLSFTPALFGGIAFMLANYLVNFGLHPQVRVDTLMPLVLYGYERLARRPGMASLLVCIGAITWTVLADFPEATFVSLQFGTLWYLYRALWAAYDARFAWAVVRPLLRNGLVAICCAFGLAAFYVLPLLENVSQSYHYHAAGTGMMTLSPWMVILSLVPGYFVLNLAWAPHYLLTVVLLAVAGVWSARRLPGHARIALFFAAYFFLGFSKSAGAPWAEWIGMLPAYNQLNFPKYITPSLEMSLLILAALGLEHIVRKGPSYRMVLPGVLFIALAIGACCWWLPLPAAEPAMFGRQLLKVLAIVGAGAGIVVVCQIFRVDSRRAAFAFIPLLVCESLFWHRHVRRPERYHSFTTPPFVEFLRKDPEPCRIFSTDGVLYPDISMAFGLDDIRYLVSLDPARRRAFYETLITPGYLDVRVTGAEVPFYFTRFFDLLNTRYIVSMPPGIMPRTVLRLTESPRHSACLARPGGPAELRTLTLDGDSYRALCVRPTAAVSCPLTVPIGRT